jgi:hypothetical protein
LVKLAEAALDALGALCSRSGNALFSLASDSFVDFMGGVRTHALGGDG